MKAEISKEFSRLRKFGYRVINFNSGRALNKWMKDFVDIVVFNSRILVFVEVKTESTKDRLTIEQMNTAVMLSSLATRNKDVNYSQVKNLQQAKNLVDRILTGKL